MMRAYDKVKWGFSVSSHAQDGYSVSWVERIKRFISTVKYDVKLNGSKSEMFKPSRGLQQGDPISPTFSYYVPKDFQLSFGESKRNAGSEVSVGRGGLALEALNKIYLSLVTIYGGRMLKK